MPEVDVEEVEAVERARGRRMSRQKCVFACKKKNCFQTSRPPGVVPGKDGTILDAGRYVRGAGGLGGRDGGGVFTMVT